MNPIIIILSAGYFTLMGLITLGLLLYRDKSNNPSESVTVIMVARNEETVLPKLLDSLSNQTYSNEKYEVLLINDDSTDGTAKVMQNYCDRFDNWHYIFHQKTEQSLKGKKGAITLGVEKAAGEIILLTDADCVVKPRWIESMASRFFPETGMVLGYSPVLKKPGFLNLYQRFDSLCEVSLAVATTFFNKPSHANGRNLAFRKKAFRDVNGYASVENIMTGDDMHLACKIRVLTKWKFRFNTDNDSFVVTDEINFGEKWFHQQLRRNSVAFDLTLPFFLMGAVVILFHAELISLLFSPAKWYLLIKLLMIKFLVELTPTAIGAGRFKQKKILIGFPILWVVYPIIFLTSHLLGAFRKYKWK